MKNRWYIVPIIALSFSFISSPQSVLLAQVPLAKEDLSFIKARELFGAGLYDPSTSHFEIREEGELSPESIFYSAQANLGLGYNERAIDLLKRLQKEYPIHPLAFEAQVALGKYFYENEQLDLATETLFDVLDSKPTDDVASRALYWIGESFERMGETETAVTYYERAAMEYSFTEIAPQALYAMGYTHAKSKEYAEAVKAFELLAARYPRSSYLSDVGIALAEAYYELGDYDRTIEEIQNRLSVLEGSNKDRAIFLMAESYNQKRDSENAILNYRLLTGGDKNELYYRPAVYGLAWNYHFEESFPWAAEQFEIAAGNSSDSLSHKASYYMGVNQRLAGMKDEAVKTFERVYNKWPRFELADRALFEAGMTYYELRNWESAKITFDRLIDDYGNSSLVGEATRMKGEASVALGDFASAFEAYDSAAGSESASTNLKEEVEFQKAWLLFRQDEFARASPAFFEIYNRNRQGDKAGDALFWGAESLFQIGNFGRSTVQFNEFIRLYPGHKQVTAARYALAWAYFRQQRYAAAAVEFERFLGADDVSRQLLNYKDDARIRLADSYYAMKQYSRALDIYAGIDNDNVRDYARYQMGQSYVHAGDGQKAKEVFADLITNFPYSEWREESLYNLGYQQFLDQEYSQAIESYLGLVQRFPDHPLVPTARYGHADALYNMGLFEESIDVYREILDFHANNRLVVDAFSGIQYCLLALDREAELASYIDSFSEKNPGSPFIKELEFRYAEGLYQSGLYEKSIEYFANFIESASDHPLLPQAYLYMGRAYNDSGLIKEAEIYLVRVVDLYPNSEDRAEALQNLGDIYLKQNRHRTALQTYRDLAQDYGDDPLILAEARYGEGRALFGLDRIEEAEQLFNQLVDASPDAPESVAVRYSLGKIAESRGEIEVAIMLYQDVISRAQDETGPETICALGELQLRRGNAAQALNDLGRLAILFPGYPEWEAKGLLLQGQAYTALDQKGDAQNVYDTIMERFGGTDTAQEAERLKGLL